MDAKHLYSFLTQSTVLGIRLITDMKSSLLRYYTDMQNIGLYLTTGIHCDYMCQLIITILKSITDGKCINQITSNMY